MILGLTLTLGGHSTPWPGADAVSLPSICCKCTAKTKTQTTGRYEEAETAYRTAKRLLPRPQPGKKLVTRIAPNSLSLFLNLGNLVARNRSRLEEADALYR